MTPEERKAELMRMITERSQMPDMGQAQANANQGNFGANMAQAAEGFVRARGQAAGGQGVNQGFYDTMRNTSNAGLNDAKAQRAEALKAMLLGRSMDEADKSAAMTADENQFQRGRQLGADNRAERSIALSEKSQGHQSKRRFETRIDPNYGAYSYDSWTGEAKPLKFAQDENAQMGAVTTGNTGEIGANDWMTADMPPSKMRGESPKQYSARTQVWKSNQLKKNQPLKDAEKKSRTFAERLLEAENVFKDLSENQDYDRSGYLSGMAAYLTPEFAKSSELRSQEQAERNFINAVLRQESGAAIAESEFESAEKQYFPRAGDSAENLEQKRRNREIVIKGMMNDGKLDSPESQAKFDTLSSNQAAQQAQPRKAEAPYGNRVAQGGKVYVWDGQQYIEE